MEGKDGIGTPGQVTVAAHAPCLCIAAQVALLARALHMHGGVQGQVQAPLLTLTRSLGKAGDVVLCPT